MLRIPTLTALAGLLALAPIAAPAQPLIRTTPANERECAYDPNFIRLSQIRDIRVQETSWRTDSSMPVGAKTYSGMIGATPFSVHVTSCEFLRMSVDATVIVRKDSGTNPIHVIDQLNRAMALPMQGESLSAAQQKELSKAGKVQVVDGLSVRNYTLVDNGGVTILTEHLWFKG